MMNQMQQMFMFPFMGNNMNNMPFQQMNVGGNSNWMQFYSINNNNQNNINPNQLDYSKFNCVFKTSNGKTFNLLFNAGRTVEDLILTFFKRVDKEDLFKKKGVSFVYNTAQLDYNSKINVENLFKQNLNPVIMVLDVNNLIGA